MKQSEQDANAGWMGLWGGAGVEAARHTNTIKPQQARSLPPAAPPPPLQGDERKVEKVKQSPSRPFFSAEDEFVPSQREIRVAGDSAKSHEMEFTSRP